VWYFGGKRHRVWRQNVEHVGDESVRVVSFELGNKRWKLTMSDGRRGSSRHSVCAGDQAAVLGCRRKAEARRRLEAHAKVHSRAAAHSMTFASGPRMRFGQSVEGHEELRERGHN
jgi:hypothetical protein